MSISTLKEIDFSKDELKEYFPSPVRWEDQVLYFLLLDRFSDGNEKEYIDNKGKLKKTGKTKKFSLKDKDNNADYDKNGNNWKGGSIKGLQSKLGYLKRLGVTAIWVSPIFRQVYNSDAYHGYGIQNYLEVDPHFGTNEEFKSFVQEAHGMGIYVIMDIILNHVGDVFDYHKDRIWFPNWDGSDYQTLGFRDENGEPTLPLEKVDKRNYKGEEWKKVAIWPEEFQDINAFSKKGAIVSWDNFPEYVEGDFFGLKDVFHGSPLHPNQMSSYQPSEAMKNLVKVYKYWIKEMDVDGFRIDTVKHMAKAAVRYFIVEIKEYAESLGKENFYLIGEIAGGRDYAYNIMQITGLDAALGIDDTADKLEWTVKGERQPNQYFDLFRNSLLMNRHSHTWLKNKIINMFDDHDQVRKGDNKARFCADDKGKALIIPVLGLNVCSLGIPCIYYGTEQNFSGQGNGDYYLRETMFGSDFGGFRTKEVHFFDEEEKTYQELSKILQVRKEKRPLRRGRQYFREVSADGINFSLPEKIYDEFNYIIPWSRIYNDEEVLMTINTDINNDISVWITVDNGLNDKNDEFEVLYSTDPKQIGKIYKVELKNGKSLKIKVPKAGFMIIDKKIK